MQGHLGARAARAHARQPDVRRVAVHIHEEDVPSVCLQKRPDPIENRLNALFGDHQVPPVGYPPEGNGHAVSARLFLRDFVAGIFEKIRFGGGEMGTIPRAA
jgi:hypothetical protein